MKTITVNLYSFNELNDEAKKVAIEKLSDINVDYQWWECTYGDAKMVDIIIDGFDLDRNRHCSGKLYSNGTDVAYKIKEQHGTNCNTYFLADSYLAEWDKLVEKYSDGKTTNVVDEENFEQFDEEADELTKQFEADLLEEYANILQREYDYLTSEEAIIQTIEVNDYFFTEDGKLA